MTLARLIGVGAALALAVAAMPAYGQVAARRALNEPIKELAVDGISLEKTMNYLRDCSGANVVVNWKVLEQAGITKETPITLSVKELPLKKMMKLVLDQAAADVPLAIDVSDNVITITTQEDSDKHMVTKVYVIDDLLLQPSNKQAPNLALGVATTGGTNGGNNQGMGFGNNPRQGGGTGTGSIFNNPTSGTPRTGTAGGTGTGPGTGTNQQTAKNTKDQAGQDLAALIREVIRPTIWKENGGTASVKYTLGKLVVTAPVSVQEAIGGPVESGIRYGD